MNLIPAAEWMPGMIVGQELRARNGRVLLAQGARLTEEYIRLLNQMGVESLYVATPKEPVVVDKDQELRQECQNALNEAVADLRRQCELKNFFIEASLIEEAFGLLTSHLLSNETMMLAVQEIHRWSARLFQHSVNTAIFATVISKERGLSQDQCRDLALGMFFHDCGQTLLPHEIFEKQGKLTEEEIQIIRQHPRAGFERVMRDQLLSPAAASVVLRHHERLDGTGYPDGLRGDSIPLLARIAAVIESFDAMTSLRVYGRPMLPDAAFRQILKQSGSTYDKQATMTLIKHIALYPNGSAVRLNTGECGIVLSTSAADTTRPLIRLFYDSEGHRMKACDLNLLDYRDRKIVQSGANLDEVKLAGHNGSGAEMEEAA